MKTATSALAFALLLLPRLVFAHAFDPNVLHLREAEGGRVRVSWSSSSPTVASRPRLPSVCQTMTREPLSLTGTRRTEQWTMRCEGGLAGARLGLEGAASDSDTLVRWRRPDGRMWTSVARAGSESLDLPSADRGSGMEVFGRYLGLGVEHIAAGVDHLMFVLGLFVLVRTRRVLFGTLTAFTLGHSVTLVSASLDWLTLRPAPVEVLIALSIILLAREIVAPAPEGSTLGERPWLAAFAFGLLHGFGFAGALGELGVPSQQIGTALFAFNVGVELGQVAFVLVLILLGRVVFTLTRGPHPRAHRLLGYGMGVFATLWVWERAVLLGA